METKTRHKVDVSSKMKPTKKVYNLLVGYDPILETEINSILKKNKIKTKITTECYFYMKHLDKNEIERIKNLIKDVKFEFKSNKDGNLKVYKVRYISATIAPELNIGKVVRLNKKRIKGKTHSSGTNLTNYSRKLNKRVKKAINHINKVEKRKNLALVIKNNKVKHIQKPVQTKLKFAA